MTAARALALLFIAAFYGVGAVDSGSFMYYALGTVLLAGFAAMAYGVLRPSR